MDEQAVIKCFMNADSDDVTLNPEKSREMLKAILCAVNKCKPE